MQQPSFSARALASPLLLLTAVHLSFMTDGAHAWPGFKPASASSPSSPFFSAPAFSSSSFAQQGGGAIIGPPCTLGAHNSPPVKLAGKCPNMKQPKPPASPFRHARHEWPTEFIVDWNMYFVMDNDDAPPYFPSPTSPYNVTSGTTYYSHDPVTGLASMRETYNEYCIPVFGDPTVPMGARNDFACSFINDARTNTSFVVMSADRPAGVPECCIIGRPFHPPPPTFSHHMPVTWRTQVNATATPPHSSGFANAKISQRGSGLVNVDWNAVFDATAGIFNYGFNGDTGAPFAFYMKGMLIRGVVRLRFTIYILVVDIIVGC